MNSQTLKSAALPSIGSIFLVALMCAGSLFLWAALPIVWLWIGSQVEAETDSLGLALAVIAVGVGVSIAVAVHTLRWVNRKHLRLREIRGKDISGLSALEIILVVTGMVAMAGFLVWFVAFSGTSPLPLNLTY